MAAAVLLTGATGYIGGRLLRHFEEAGRPVRCLARNPERLQATRSTTEVVPGDCLDEESLDLALVGVDSAYSLVHSMSNANTRSFTSGLAVGTVRAGIGRHGRSVFLPRRVRRRKGSARPSGESA
jgi:uncharacterized protein YbjT (DUF2867 family)